MRTRVDWLSVGVVFASLLVLCEGMCRGVEIKPATSVPSNSLVNVIYEDGGKANVEIVRCEDGKPKSVSQLQVPGKTVFKGPDGLYVVSGIEKGRSFLFIVKIGDGEEPDPPGPDPDPDPEPDPPGPEPDPPGPQPDDGAAKFIKAVADRVAKLPPRAKAEAKALAAIYRETADETEKTLKSPNGIRFRVRDRTTKEISQVEAWKPYLTWQQDELWSWATKKARKAEDYAQVFRWIAQGMEKGGVK